MATRSANLPIAPSGDGPSVAIADLVGQKTVVLSGQFQGSYTLFASHDGSNFAPTLLFNSDDQEQISSYLPGRIWMRGSRYGDPTQLTTTPILSIGGSVGGVPDKFRVLGNGQMYTQNMLTLQGGLVATYEVTSTSTATATYSSGNTYIVTNTTTSTASGTGPFIMGGNMTLSITSTATSTLTSASRRRSVHGH